MSAAGQAWRAPQCAIGRQRGTRAHQALCSTCLALRYRRTIRSPPTTITASQISNSTVAASSWGAECLAEMAECPGQTDVFQADAHRLRRETAGAGC